MKEVIINSFCYQHLIFTPLTDNTKYNLQLLPRLYHVRWHENRSFMTQLFPSEIPNIISSTI